jgi:hypothetical protein
MNPGAQSYTRVENLMEAIVKYYNKESHRSLVSHSVEIKKIIDYFSENDRNIPRAFSYALLRSALKSDQKMVSYFYSKIMID